MKLQSKSTFTQKESGQGLIEYALILILIAVVIYAAVKAVPTVVGWFSNDNNSASTVSTPIPQVFPDESAIEKLVETGKIVEIIETETTTTNNCGSSTATEIQTQRTRNVEHLVVLEGQGGIVIGDVEFAQIPALKLLKVSLEGKYGIQDKQIEQRTYSIKFITNPAKLATHTVAWKYTWYTGEATVKFQDSTEQIYKYKVRALLEPETTSIDQNCTLEPTSAP